MGSRRRRDLDVKAKAGALADDPRRPRSTKAFADGVAGVLSATWSSRTMPAALSSIAQR
ncbi:MULTISPECIES: hypothetical protein [Streptomyces]|uniref:Uncharacterized protein n=1 Tax=Streptomyces stelliscabiei TaxID=146820 RepID=A0A8I0P178_9ACTN|nr:MULTISPECIES: hypothetical protein [Streptomyces]MBE1594389.1 hypothetical protein [Streptomyces stelliscabiei]MDX2518945.1 hypothetical protein [Streptomyces stelliscabiei]MDX2556424.1 hypothetical protein [Streptomyces stelliscabiei]MDX2615104.1 hypothetical protein [Streptomyces stelliscabiei]MDX2640291.1 hypothetical protein [Streptomyces stelliscabiei]